MILKPTTGDVIQIFSLEAHLGFSLTQEKLPEKEV